MTGPINFCSNFYLWYFVVFKVKILHLLTFNTPCYTNYIVYWMNFQAIHSSLFQATHLACCLLNLIQLNLPSWTHLVEWRGGGINCPSVFCIKYHQVCEQRAVCVLSNQDGFCFYAFPTVISRASERHQKEQRGKTPALDPISNNWVLPHGVWFSGGFSAVPFVGTRKPQLILVCWVILLWKDVEFVKCISFPWWEDHVDSPSPSSANTVFDIDLQWLNGLCIS